MESPVDLAPHGLTALDVVALLETDQHQGLSEQTAARRRERLGPNVLPAPKRAGAVVRALRQFHHPLIYVLLGAAAITAGLAEYVDSAVILAVVVVNAAIGIIQESKAESALDGLRSMAQTVATVVRDGHGRSVSSEELVPGDIVLLEAGQKVPADLRLTQLSELAVNESALTGEATAVRKADVELPAATTVADRCNMAYAGTLVTAGRGVGIVVATGSQTELGEIHRLIRSADTLATPLTQQLAQFSKLLTAAILALAAATFAVGMLRGQEAAETFTAAVALAVGAIPEGLPAAVTITLAIGVARMARRGAIIRHLPAVETLGSTTVVCSDKTGTLTENQMTVRAVWTPDREFEVSGSGYDPAGTLSETQGRAGTGDSSAALRWSLLAGAACNDAALTSTSGRWEVIGDPTEGAMLVVAEKSGLTHHQVRAALPRLATVSFSSDRQYMATLHRDLSEDHPERRVVLAKGAVERVLDRCAGQLQADGSVRPLDREAVLVAAGRLAGQGLRVLATAMDASAAPQAADPALFVEGSLSNTWVLTGLQAMLDPPRAAATTAVRACHTAGIAVKMITGDHAGTATAIATQVGLLCDPERDGSVLTGSQLEALTAKELSAAVNRATVFARVSPEQKLRLVAALQAHGQVVAMTGDGVNDAPALRQAGIGVAMGMVGTEVAKDAADMILTDDDFATLEAAIEEGRGVFDNLTKFITWTLPTNVGEGLVILVAVMFGSALPILPTQILWINMTSAVLLGLMLAFEPKEPGIMTRPPRNPGQPLLTRVLMWRILLVSAILVAGSWWLFDWERANGASLAEARTAALNLFVMVEAFYLFSCRSLTRSPWRIGWFTNRWLIVGLTLQAIGQLAITYLPVMNAVFDTSPIGADVWVRILAVSVVGSAAVAVDKRFRGGKRRTSPTAASPGCLEQ